MLRAAQKAYWYPTFNVYYYKTRYVGASSVTDTHTQTHETTTATLAHAPRVNNYYVVAY